MQLRDPHGRTFRYLRLSVTDACNFQCQYCLPDGYQRPAERPALLSIEEITRLLASLSELGIEKVRLTGGEPTLRPDLIPMIESLAALPDISTIALSTNGFRLKKLASDLINAGLSSANISVDSLKPERFKKLTGQDRLSDVMQGIFTLFELGLTAVKINTVLLKDFNFQELSAFLELVKETPLTVRFIELMYTESSEHIFDNNHISSSLVVDYLSKEGWSENPRELLSGPAREFSHPDYSGKVGVIAPYSKGFCQHCNRLRVDSDGNLYLCLFDEGRYPLRPFLQADSQRKELQEAVQEHILNKPLQHRLEQRIYGKTSSLSVIGG